MSATAWAWLVLLLPLLGSIVISLGFRAIPARVAGAIGTAAIGLAFLCAIGALVNLLGEEPDARHHASSLWDYASAGGLDVKLGIYVDQLSAFMMLVVTGVSTLIHLYSFGYMRSDEGYHRFFSYLNFFVFSMLLLVLAGNFVLLTVGWAFVGFASYALISFWYRRATATAAGMKAFVINVVGDIGLVLAAFLIFRELGTFEYAEAFARAPDVFARGEWTVTAICLLLLVGAFAKSAQIPFHTWLPDAMEGPTPVSSLIHAATMVTAGVYLIARTHVLFYLAPTAADVGAFVGLATLLIAGTIAIAMTDLKRAIAYSTMSQIGYMIMGVSIGAYSAGLFHLMTHAFFKALLFMAAGSIISAMANRQDIDRMSGFWKAMRFTSLMLLVGGLALAAFPLTSGFFSKDSILAYAEARGGMYFWMAVGGYVGAFLTALYTFRLIFRVLPGKPCEEAQHLIDSGQLYHGEPRNPANDELEDADVGFPGATPPHRRAVLADGGGDGGARLRRAVRRPDPGPRRRQRPLRLPRAGLPRLAAGRDPPQRRGRVARAGDRRRDLAARHRHRLAALGGAAAAAGALPRALPPAVRARLQQVVLRRGDRPPRRAAGAGDRPLRQLHLRAARRRRPRQRRQGDRRRRRRHRPRRAERLRAQLRAAADRRPRRPRPLLPAERLMINSLLWTPLAFGLIGLFVPKRLAGWWATLGTAVTLGLAIALLAGFDSGAAGLQDSVDVNWIPGLGVDYSLGIDGLNVFLVLLTAVLWTARNRLRCLAASRSDPTSSS